MIICFEGASAVGKTTLSQRFSEDYLIVPEVNLLWDRESSDSELWYYEKQVQRFHMCETSDKSSIFRWRYISTSMV